MWVNDSKRMNATDSILMYFGSSLSASDIGWRYINPQVTIFIDI
jgi:hypothetical protein